MQGWAMSMMVVEVVEMSDKGDPGYPPIYRRLNTSRRRLNEYFGLVGYAHLFKRLNSLSLAIRQTHPE